MFDVDPIIFEKYRASVDLTNFPKQFVHWLENATPDEKTKWYTERFKCMKYPLYLSGFAVAEKVGDPSLPAEYVPIMGMDFQPDPHQLLFDQYVQFRPGEGLVLSDLDQSTKKRMILWPRGIFKTSSIVVYIVQMILNYPNVRICFLTGGDTLAKRQLGRIKRVFEKPTKRFSFLFPEFCLVSKEVKRKIFQEDPKGKIAQVVNGEKLIGKMVSVLAWEDVPAKMGNAHEFTVPCRTTDIFAEPTFAISTARSVKAGSHYEAIFIDDLVNENNYKSVKLLEKCFDDYISICPLLEPTGYINMTGTRYTFGDTYELIQDTAKKEERELGRTIWKFSIRDCWSMGCQNCTHTDVYHDYNVNMLEPPCIMPGCGCIGFKARGNKGVLFPQTRTHDGRSMGHTLEFLEGERIRLGAEFFANQYENKPIATGSQTFTETLIGRQTLHDMGKIPPYGVAETFAVGDLAYVGQEGRDYSVIFICRLFQGQIFIFDCVYGNWDSAAVAENTINVLLKHRPSIMYYERFNGWEAYNNVISAAALTKGVQKVPIQWEKGSQAENAKLIRIGLVKGPLDQRRLWFYAGMPGYQILTNQLVKWPKLGRHDDFADTAGMVVAAPTGYHGVPLPQAESAKGWLWALNQERLIEGDGRNDGSQACGME